jgi:hypothetical protein
MLPQCISPPGAWGMISVGDGLMFDDCLLPHYRTECRVSGMVAIEILLNPSAQGSDS